MRFKGNLNYFLNGIVNYNKLSYKILETKTERKKMKVEKINISPSYSDALITYVRLYSKMNNQGKKNIERDLKNWGQCLDKYKKGVK